MDFPPSNTAREEPNGLLAAGGDLSVPRLLAAYSQGIFPWYQDGQPILWWTPDPRIILRPSRCHVSRSMAKFLRKTQWRIKIDCQFAQIISACGDERLSSGGTWITREMRDAYIALHKKGFAHSIEIYDGKKLQGGLYGVSLGKVFFGESMFSRATNASKMALIGLSRFLDRQQFRFIDCQVSSDHLLSLGAEEISRENFEKELSLAIDEPQIIASQYIWQRANNRVVAIDGYIAD